MDIHKLRDDEYDGFVALWHDSFGDDPGVYDEMVWVYGDDLKSYVLIDESQRSDSDIPWYPDAALTQFIIGSMNITSDDLISDAPDVYVSYAISTDPDKRGRGYGSSITSYARESTISTGGLSLLSPAEPSLIDFYTPLGYVPYCYAEGRLATANASSESDLLIAVPIDAIKYNDLREKYLSGRVHVALSDKTLNYIERNSRGFYELILPGNELDATDEIRSIAYVEWETDDTVLLTELITSAEMGGHISNADRFASAFAAYFGMGRCSYYLPAWSNSDTAMVQGMISGTGSETAVPDNNALPYLGFTFG